MVCLRNICINTLHKGDNDDDDDDDDDDDNNNNNNLNNLSLVGYIIISVVHQQCRILIRGSGLAVGNKLR